MRFDEYSLLMQGNDGGPVIVAGNAEESILFEVITLPPDDDMIMPPKGDPLTADQIELFRRWIMEGASEKPTGKVVTATVSKDNENAGAQGDGVIHKAPPKKKSYSEKVLFSLTYSYLLASAQKRLWPSCKVRNPSQVNRLTSTVTPYPSSTTDAIVVTTPPLTEAVDSSIRRLLFGLIHTNK